MADLPNDHANYRGHDVIDDHAKKVGTVTDVVYDAEGRPAWVVIDPGTLRSAHYAPVSGSYVTENGMLTIPFTKEQVRTAPKAHSDHIVTPDLQQELVEHYELV